MSGTRKLLIPRYMRRFKCIGPECEDSCCIGWFVHIDQATYRRYQKIRDVELKGKICKLIKRNKSNAVNSNYAMVKLDSGGSCPFLNEQHLCSFQLKLGEEYLSDVCYTYPRVANEVNGVLEKSSSMACPEAARLALLNPDIMEFDVTEEPVTVRNMIYRRLDTRQLSLRYFWELRMFTIGLLQNRRYMLAERLIVLGLFFQRLQKLEECRNLENIPNLIGTHINLVAVDDVKQQFMEIPAQVAIQMELLKELVEVRLAKGISNQRYLDCVIQFCDGTQCTNEATVEEIAARYQDAEEKYYRPFMAEREYIMENYLVNYVFKNLFPIEDFFNNYVLLILHYALIKMHLIGMAAFNQGLTEELVIKLIQSFAKTVEHDSQYVRQVFNLLKSNGYTTMAHMAILIKN